MGEVAAAATSAPQTPPVFSEATQEFQALRETTTMASALFIMVVEAAQVVTLGLADKERLMTIQVTVILVVT